MRENQEPRMFERLPTPDVRRISILLWVLADKIKDSTVITPGVTLNAFSATLGTATDGAKPEFGDYLLSEAPARSDAGYLGYTFVKPQTPAEKRTPFRVTPTTEPLTWDAWLMNLYGGVATRTLDTESGAAGATSTSNTRTRREFQDRYQLIPALNGYPTEMLIEEFLSPTKFTPVVAEAPVPTLVRYFYKGTQNSIVCLHDDVTVPNEASSFTRDPVFGTPDAQELPEDQFFPATTPKGWTLYTVSARQTFRDDIGLWHLERKRVNRLPPLPEPLRF